MPKDKGRQQRRELEDAELAQLSERLERLRVAFERYFRGLDKVPPLKDRDKLERDLRNTWLHRAKRTGTTFRFNNLQQRRVTYASYWDRIMRMIEEGTFRRERTGAQLPPLRAARAAEQPAESEPEGRPNEAAREPAASAPGGDDRVWWLYEDFRIAQESLGSNPMEFERFREKIENTRQKQVAKLGCADVEYRVTIKSGKVALQARPVYADKK